MLVWVSLFILLIYLFAQLYSRFFGDAFKILGLKLFHRYISISAVVVIFSVLFYQSFKQYEFWLESGEVSRFLLPPYQNIAFFLFYVGTRFFAPYLISTAVAGLFFWGVKLLNKKYGERFFYPEEIWVGALAIFLAGHPGWLFYLISLILVYLSVHLLIRIYSLFITHYSPERLSLYYLWLPTAIFVIIIDNWWLRSLPFWQILKI